MKIEPGSIVVLKSGGPTMTVSELGEHADGRCFWFCGNELGSEWFALAALRLAPPVPQAVGSSSPRFVAQQGQVQQQSQYPNGPAAAPPNGPAAAPPNGPAAAPRPAAPAPNPGGV